MDQKKFLSFLKKTVSYVLVAALASAGTWFAADKIPNSKLERLSAAIENRFIGQSDKTRREDAAAAAETTADASLKYQGLSIRAAPPVLCP